MPPYSLCKTWFANYYGLHEERLKTSVDAAVCRDVTQIIRKMLRAAFQLALHNLCSQFDSPTYLYTIKREIAIATWAGTLIERAYRS